MVEEFYLADIEIRINEAETLPLSALSEFAHEYAVQSGATLRITTRWGGPAAQGGPEIAVVIFLGEIIRRGAADVYKVLRMFLEDVYHKIRTRTGARLFINGALCLVSDQPDAARLLFVFPEGVESNELRLALDQMEATARDYPIDKLDVPEEMKTVAFVWSRSEQTWTISGSLPPL